ncbi:MAG: metallophosphoesterase [candidate division Zixibacteria bacterium]|nr:metallophosphoesterase [candidate division Zixibacteria bacterium]
MRSFYPLIFSIIFILFFGLLEIFLLRLLNKVWWKKRLVRYAAIGLPIFGSMMVLLWALGEYNTIGWLAFTGAILAVTAFILEFALMLSLPVSGALHLFQHLVDFIAKKKSGQANEVIDQKRRLFLKTAAVAVPAITVVGAVSGITNSFHEVNVYRRKLFYKDLPEELEGLKIFHLSDPHLHHYVTLSDLEDVLTAAEKFRPDITLVTGDIADDLNLLADALNMIEQLNSPLGSFASLGNHEYFRGVKRVKRIFDKSHTPLLVDEGLILPVGNLKLMIGGADDPVRMRVRSVEFFRTSIDYLLSRQPLGDFSILMSHRPYALDYASEKEFDMVLAGHTHGGQIGFMGRSVFESVWPDRYLWGEYSKGKTKLYTSSGMGHWFPFRLGCPCEAPILELHRA